MCGPLEAKPTEGEFTTDLGLNSARGYHVRVYGGATSCCKQVALPGAPDANKARRAD